MTTPRLSICSAWPGVGLEVALPRTPNSTCDGYSLSIGARASVLGVAGAITISVATGSFSPISIGEEPKDYDVAISMMLISPRARRGRGALALHDRF